MIDSEIVEGFSGQRVLITGGTGYLATNMVRALHSTTCHIIRLARPGAAFTWLSGQAIFEDVRGNVCDLGLWEHLLNGVDIIFHFAAQTSVYAANDDPAADAEVNVWPMLRLLETCRRHGWHPSVVLAGTVTQMGLPTYLSAGEMHLDQPVTVYDLHKLMAEMYLKYYAHQGVVRGTTLRLANVYGPGPASSRADRGVLNRLIRKALSGETLPIYGDGCQMRDYIYVEDVVSAFLLAGTQIDALNGEHWIIGSGEGHTIAEAVNLVADRVALRTGKQVSVVHVDPPLPQSPIEARNFVADSSRFARATGWQARVSLTEGIDRTIEAFLKEEPQP